MAVLPGKWINAEVRRAPNGSVQVRIAGNPDVTDRALRYRANANPPKGPKRRSDTVPF